MCYNVDIVQAYAEIGECWYVSPTFIFDEYRAICIVAVYSLRIAVVFYQISIFCLSTCRRILLICTCDTTATPKASTSISPIVPLVGHRLDKIAKVFFEAILVTLSNAFQRASIVSCSQ